MELPDGRTLIEHVDERGRRSLVVTGNVAPRPSAPPAGVPRPSDDQIIDALELPDGRFLISWRDARGRVVEAVQQEGPSLTAHQAMARSHRRTRRDRAAAERKAEALLRSLLNVGQRWQWDRQRIFWVDTPRGPVRLGVLYDLRHLPNDGSFEELSLCVVPENHGELPHADIWANLLLLLMVEPDRFFDVAIVRDRQRRDTLF